MGRRKLWWNWSCEDVLASQKAWQESVKSSTRAVSSISETKKAISLLHALNKEKFLVGKARKGIFWHLENFKVLGDVEIHIQVRIVLQTQNSEEKYGFICWLITELGESLWDRDYKNLRLEVIGASTTKFTDVLGESWIDEDDLRTFYRIPWLHAPNDYSQFIFPDEEHILPILCMKIEWCNNHGHFEKVLPSLSVFDDELLDSLHATTSLIHIEKFIQRVIAYHQKTRPYPMIPLEEFDNPEISLNLIFWFINNHKIELESRWKFFSRYAKESWIGKWSEEFCDLTIENMYENERIRGSPHCLFARMFFGSLEMNWDKPAKSTDEWKTYTDRLSELDIAQFEFPQDYDTFVKNDEIVIQTINDLLEKMARNPEDFSHGIGELDAWQELLVLFREEDGIKVPIINEPLHRSSDLKGISLLLNVLGHGLSDPPEDIVSWAKLIQRGLEESKHDSEGAFCQNHFLRHSVLDRAGVLIASTNPNSNTINQAISALFSNSDVGPAMMIGVDLCLKCSMDMQNIQNPGFSTNQKIMKHLFSQISNIQNLEDYDDLLSHIINDHYSLETAEGYDGTDDFLKLIDGKARTTFSAYASWVSHIIHLLENKDLLTPEKLSKIPNLLKTERFVDQLIDSRNLGKSFSSQWFKVLRKTGIDWSSK